MEGIFDTAEGVDRVCATRPASNRNAIEEILALSENQSPVQVERIVGDDLIVFVMMLPIAPAPEFVLPDEACGASARNDLAAVPDMLPVSCKSLAEHLECCCVCLGKPSILIAVDMADGIAATKISEGVFFVGIDMSRYGTKLVGVEVLAHPFALPDTCAICYERQMWNAPKGFAPGVFEGFGLGIVATDATHAFGIAQVAMFICFDNVCRGWVIVFDDMELALFEQAYVGRIGNVVVTDRPEIATLDGEPVPSTVAGIEAVLPEEAALPLIAVDRADFAGQDVRKHFIIAVDVMPIRKKEGVFFQGSESLWILAGKFVPPAPEAVSIRAVIADTLAIFDLAKSIRIAALKLPSIIRAHIAEENVFSVRAMAFAQKDRMRRAGAFDGQSSLDGGEGEPSVDCGVRDGQLMRPCRPGGIVIGRRILGKPLMQWVAVMPVNFWHKVESVCLEQEIECRPRRAVDM